MICEYTVLNVNKWNMFLYKSQASLHFWSVCWRSFIMRHVVLNTKRYKLPSHLEIPTTPFPSKGVKRNLPGSNLNRPSLFRRIPDQSDHSKALLAVNSTKVEEKLVTDYTKQAKAADKKHLDGKTLNEALILDTLEQLKSKKKTTKGKRPPTKKKKKATSKKLKKKTQPNFSITSWLAFELTSHKNGRANSWNHFPPRDWLLATGPWSKLKYCNKQEKKLGWKGAFLSKNQKKSTTATI